MNTIEINAIKAIDFAKEIKKIELEDILKFKITDSIMLNINILFYYLKLKKVKQIILVKNEDRTDVLALRKFIVYIQKSYLHLSNDFLITFENFLDGELYLFMGERNYLNYCYHNNIEPKWNDNFLKKENLKIERNKNLMKYETFKYLIEKQKEMPYSKFNFPHEDKIDRFVFYFNCYSEKLKNEALEIIDNLRSIEKQDKYYNSNLENAYYEIKNLISKNKINEETYYYAIGLSYKNDKIERISLYSKFANALIIKGEIKKFIQERHDIQIKEEFENVWYYAIDYYENKEEIKVYEEPFIFKEKMNDEILNKVFHNKECVKVSKYRDNHKIDEKFEFEYDRILTNEEKDILRQNKLFDKQYKILAFYIRDGEIFKKTMYNL